MMINTTSSDWICNAYWPFVLPETDARKEPDVYPQLRSGNTIRLAGSLCSASNTLILADIPQLSHSNRTQLARLHTSEREFSMGAISTFLVPDFQQYRFRGFQKTNSRFLKHRLRTVTSVRHLSGKPNCQALERCLFHLIN